MCLIKLAACLSVFQCKSFYRIVSYRIMIIIVNNSQVLTPYRWEWTTTKRHVV